MTEAAKGVSFRKRQKRQREQELERQALLESLEQTRVSINQAFIGFNSVCDADLIESYVFEIKALQARYCYLLRRVKELDGDQNSAGQPAPLTQALRP